MIKRELGTVMSEADILIKEVKNTTDKLAHARAAIAKRFIGQERVVDLTLATLLSGGHGLLVGVPGLGKTRLVEAISTVMGLNGNRVQFTPDLMPADILGSEVLETHADGTRQFRFIQGPIFCQLLMADEINRASPRTQSALLQAMQEKSVTIAGQDRAVGHPFHVLATQNPIDQEGTYPLPEAQLDRFLLQIDVPYPSAAAEAEILLATTGSQDAAAENAMSVADLIAAQELVRKMPVGENLVSLILELVRALRPDGQVAPDMVRENVLWGPGPRAAQALMLTCRAWALLNGNLAPSAKDIVDLAGPVLRHRMALQFGAAGRGVMLEDVLNSVLDQVLPERAAA